MGAASGAPIVLETDCIAPLQLALAAAIAGLASMAKTANRASSKRIGDTISNVAACVTALRSFGGCGDRIRIPFFGPALAACPTISKPSDHMDGDNLHRQAILDRFSSVAEDGQDLAAP